jgi:dTMP kinase
MSQGRFIVLEGIEGAGKSTQSLLLASWLESVGIHPVAAREPGGTPVGEAIRSILLSEVELSIPTEAELLLILAARAAFVRDIVRPALEKGGVVVADRYAYSTYAYQGFGRGLDLGEIRRLNGFATGDLDPDLTIVLDVPVQRGIARKETEGKPGDRFELSGIEFLQRVRTGYRTLVQEDPRAVILDASPGVTEVHDRIKAVLMDRFPETFHDGEV